MSLFGKLFGKKADDFPYHLTLQLNARLMPIDRGDWYEDPLDDALAKAGIGGVSGGGTLMELNGEIKHCDVEIDLRDAACYSELLRILNQFALPKGSILHAEDSERELGELEGLALYLNGTELADEVYQSCDINFVIAELNRLMAGKGEFYSSWQGPQDTALYFYGPAFAPMKEAIMPFIAEYPLCEKSIIVQIA